jgi:hypothetical protein
MAMQMLADNLGPGAYSADWLRAKIEQLSGH